MREPYRVGIVTRTKNRPVLLRRAIESVLHQSYGAWTMFIVNDGGDREPLDALVAVYAAAAGGRIRVIHEERSHGMEGASAIGLAAAAPTSEALIIHDDDDSWSPEFLDITTSELARLRGENASVHGVVTYSNRVMEQVRGNIIDVVSIEPFNGWIPPGFLSLDRLLVSNVLPPISFLFTREAFAALGSLYEEIPYLGDWGFLLRFLMQFEILVIPLFLAFYHWRTDGAAGALGNSGTAEVDRHRFYRGLLLNRWLRADLKEGRFGVGAYANIASRIARLDSAADEAPPQPYAAASPPLQIPLPSPVAARDVQLAAPNETSGVASEEAAGRADGVCIEPIASRPPTHRMRGIFSLWR